MGKLFGTDGIRGIANVAPMDSETVMRLGRAAAQVFRQSSGRHRILIGKDTRLSGYMLETALESGIASMGVDVLLVGPLPTPGIAYMTRSMRADAGIMISASHNSYEDNGIKFFAADGFKLPDKTEDEIERLMQPGHLDELRANPELIGKAFRIDDALGRYIVYLKSCIEREIKFDGLKLVIDTANGAAYKVAPMLMAELGAEIITIGDHPNGTNINKNCGSLYPEIMQQQVLKSGADAGIAFDGDADRVILCDEKGQLIDGDLVLAICANDFKTKGTLKGDAVVGTVMSNLGLEIALKKMGLSLFRSDVGDRYVLGEIIARNLNLGGEQSGHIISLDHNTTGDGLLTALLVLSIAIKSEKPLSSFQDLMIRYPQVLLNVRVHDKPPIDQIPGMEKLMSQSRSQLGDKGRFLIRYSGTESKLRVMVEAENESLCKSTADNFVELIQKNIGA